MTVRLDTFSDGLAAEIVAFGACESLDSNLSLVLPYDAFVSEASLSAAILANSSSSDGALSFDIGGTGSFDSKTLNGSLAMEFSFDAYRLNYYLRSRGATSGNITVPIVIKACPSTFVLPGTWLVLLNNLSVIYTVEDAVNGGLVFAGRVPDMYVTAGADNLSAYDLAANFNDPQGDALSYSAQLQFAERELTWWAPTNTSDLAATGVSVTLNGSVVDIHSSNASWWGSIYMAFMAQDTTALTSRSNQLVVHVSPSAEQLARYGLESHSIYAVVATATCGPVHTERFQVPVDAVVTSAGMYVSLDSHNLTAMDATIEVHAGAWLLAHNTTGNTSYSFSGSLGDNGYLDSASLNAYLRNTSSTAGLVDLDLVVSVCPTLGVAAITISTASIAYVRASANHSSISGQGAGAYLSGISVHTNGSSNISADTPLTLEAISNLTADVEFTWFIDGNLSGHGRTLEGITLGAGEHTVEVRASNGTAVFVYSTKVTALALPPASTPPGASPWGFAWFAAAAGLIVVGAVVGGTERGRWMLLAVVGSVFSRLKRASLLDHFVRGTLYQVIRENPGVHFAELRRRAQIANGVASYHLRVLEKGGYVRVVIDGTKTRFYVTDRPLEEEVYGISDTERAILDAVVATPGIGQGELAAKVERSVSVVSRSVTRLVSMGYVTTDHENGRVHIFPRPGAEPAVLLPAWPDEGD